MEGNKYKKLIADPEFDSLIPKPSGRVEIIKRHARLEDTLAFLPEAVKKVAWQVEKIAPLLKGRTLEETCQNIWERFYTRIQYRKDEPNKEQIQSPRVTWGLKAGDCDDFAVLVSAVLCVLRIPHMFRIMAQTEENGYQHIYVVVPNPAGEEIKIDCVLPRFNYEVPYIKKIDQEMELQFLDGVDDNLLETFGSIDAEDLCNGDLGELGKRLKDRKFVKKVTQTVNKAKDKVKDTLHKVNKVNPATALLRAGVLASMKLNVFKVAGHLRHTYLPDEQARQRGFDMKKFARLKWIREKLEKIFHGAGGEKHNLKKAILEGKGNANKEVPLSGFLTPSYQYTEDSELSQLLGVAAYREEFLCSKEMGSLGAEPTTTAALAAASTAIAALAALIKDLGPLKRGKTANASSTASATSSEASSSSGSDSASAETASTDSSSDPKLPTAGGANSGGDTDTPASATDKGQNENEGSGDGSKDTSKPTARDTGETEDKGFFERAKTWVKENKGTAIGIAAATLAASILVGVGLSRRRKKEKSKQSGLSGVKYKKKARHKVRIQRLR